MKYLIALLARVLIWTVWLIKLPFVIAAALSNAVIEWLNTVQFDLRAACPWPWITKFEEMWEKADHSERARLIRNLRGETL